MGASPSMTRASLAIVTSATGGVVPKGKSVTLIATNQSSTPPVTGAETPKATVKNVVVFAVTDTSVIQLGVNVT